MTAKHLDAGDAELPGVGGGSGFFAAELFGRHIGQCAEQGLRAGQRALAGAAGEPASERSKLPRLPDAIPGERLLPSTVSEDLRGGNPPVCLAFHERAPALRVVTAMYGKLPYDASTVVAMSTLARLDLRIAPEDKARIERAARLRGVPISTFIRDVALREAEHIAAAELAVTLSAEESRRLLDTLDAPWAPNAKLARALMTVS